MTMKKAKTTKRRKAVAKPKRKAKTPRRWRAYVPPEPTPEAPTEYVVALRVPVAVGNLLARAAQIAEQPQEIIALSLIAIALANREMAEEGARL